MNILLLLLITFAVAISFVTSTQNSVKKNKIRKASLGCGEWWRPCIGCSTNLDCIPSAILGFSECKTGSDGCRCCSIP